MKEERKLIFEYSDERNTEDIVNLSFPEDFSFPSELLRSREPHLPQVSEVTVIRHFTRLSEMNLGVDHTFYPLGSCTMKYNPRFSLQSTSHPGALWIHPLQSHHDVQGALKIMRELEQFLSEIVGLHAASLMPSAGAHGELTGLLIISKYLREKGSGERRKIIVPDTAHGTNPASCTMAGFEVLQVKSGPDGYVRFEDVKPLVDEHVAGIMLTNPNTFGIFEKDFKKIADLIHEAGGLVYMDGANLNALMGKVRPGDIGADVVQLNLHKTFGIPHGGGGPGSGPVVVRDFLEPYLPGERIIEENGILKLQKREKSIGRVRAFPCHFLPVLQAYAYILRLGRSGLKEVSEVAVLNACYLRKKLEKHFHMPYSTPTLHEFVLTDKYQREKSGITAMDMAKALLDRGFHPPTVYFPITFQGTIMIEPTETESRETLDAFAEALINIIESDPQEVKQAPQKTPVKRIDEVRAARKPVLKFTPK